jgi:hypothetical protein
MLDVLRAKRAAQGSRFGDNIRYKSLTREGWILFLSG